MKRLALAVITLAIVAAIGWPVAEGVRAASGVCADMTPVRMLENPALAEEYARALRSGEPEQVREVEGLFASIRAAHGCQGLVELPREAPRGAMPPGHPPVPAHPAPPSEGLGPAQPTIFQAPTSFTI